MKFLKFLKFFKRSQRKKEISICLLDKHFIQIHFCHLDLMFVKQFNQMRKS